MSDTATKPNPREELADLEERIRDGDTSVTPAALAKARQNAELYELHEQAAERQREREAAEKREAEVKAFRAEIAALRDKELSAAQDAFESLVNALKDFDRQISAWNTKQRDLALRSRVVGLTAEVDELPKLPHPNDAITEATNEARGIWPRGWTSKKIGRLTVHPYRRHALHSDRYASQLQAEVEEADADAAARHEEMHNRKLARLEQRRQLEREARARQKRPAIEAV